MEKNKNKDEDNGDAVSADRAAEPAESAKPAEPAESAEDPLTAALARAEAAERALADAQAKQAAADAAAKAGLPAALAKFLAAVAPEQMEAAANELKGYIAGQPNPLVRNEPTPHAATSGDSDLDAIGARLFRK